MALNRGREIRWGALACAVLALMGCASSNKGRGGPLGQAERYTIEMQLKNGGETVTPPPVEVSIGQDGSSDWDDYLLGVNARNRNDGLVDVHLRFFIKAEEGYRLVVETTIATYPGQAGYTLESTRSIGSIEFGVIPWPMRQTPTTESS